MDGRTWQELRLLATGCVRGLGANPSASVEPQVTAADNLTAALRLVLSRNHPGSAASELQTCRNRQTLGLHAAPHRAAIGGRHTSPDHKSQLLSLHSASSSLPRHSLPVPACLHSFFLECSFPVMGMAGSLRSFRSLLTSQFPSWLIPDPPISSHSRIPHLHPSLFLAFFPKHVSTADMARTV